MAWLRMLVEVSWGLCSCGSAVAGESGCLPGLGCCSLRTPGRHCGRHTGDCGDAQWLPGGKPVRREPRAGRGAPRLGPGGFGDLAGGKSRSLSQLHPGGAGSGAPAGRRLRGSPSERLWSGSGGAGGTRGRTCQDREAGVMEA